MEKMMKACFEPHVMVHSLTGLAIGFILVGLLPALVDNAMMIGIVLLVVGVLADFAVNPAKK